MVILNMNHSLPGPAGSAFEACENDITDDGIPSFKPHFSSPNSLKALACDGRKFTIPRAKWTDWKETQRIEAGYGRVEKD